ncbi:MAG: multidrug efflux pump VmrA [Candidatus Methanofastidiosum methylothiophilum]|uniref:Multidrug efflux pump VmrA n=1 Tax=Candidatus Methanofastidiosum methylothiophilum TaxID=1705564 RepID=A0A150IPC1_9EURY|nr:MAG: multidrug efflux pump VmrA [Candidatus Methanofastidiosum methylthiophilus]
MGFIMSDSIIQNQQKEHSEGVKTLLGDPKRAIIKLAMPMIIAMLVQTLYNFADALWVSFLGPDALSAVGFFFPFFFMIMSVGAGIGMGGSAAISRFIGAHKKEEADNVAAHTIVLMVILGIIITIPFVIFSRNIFELMGAGNVIDEATVYAQIMFAGTLLIFFSNIANSILRGEGDAKRSMYAMAFGSVLNIVLDPIFIYPLKMGVAGAAWASIVSMAISAGILFYWLFIKKNSYVSINLSNFRFHKFILLDILRVGVPFTLSQLLMSFSFLALNLIVVSVGGTDGIAVYTTGWRIVMFGTLPLVGMATAVTAVTGAAYGANEIKKIDIAYLYSVKIGLIIEVFVAIIVFIFAPQIASIFTQSEGGARIFKDIISFLRITAIFYPLVSFGMFSSALFQGTGKGMNSLIITLFRTIIFIVPFSYLFAIPLKMGLDGAWWGLVAGNIIGSGIAFIWARFYVNRLLKINSLS